jgi:class 3 adenylate cyclase/tetratricopeptide (TPR) repeat protein
VDIESWLNGIGLRQYAEVFRSNDVDGDLLRRLTGDDLKELGVASFGHRKKLLEAIATFDTASETGAGGGTAAGTFAASLRGGAERRQLTVMFVDLVGSTLLASRLDPEDLRQLIGRYHEAVGAAVAPYEGHIAQFLGDGVLVYFGYPRAHEDDATRAVRSALNILKTLQGLSVRGQMEVQTRIGIATGLVVVGEIGAGTAAAERSASGGAPNLAARLQAQAQPGEILLADDTRHLIGESFVLESLGALELKGFAAPVQGWRVLRERAGATRFESQHVQGLAKFVGRESEVALLLDRWALAREGEGQAVLLSGEAGIGKSRICQTLRERLAGETVDTVMVQCSPYFSSSAFYPVVQHLERAAGLAPTDAPEIRRHKVRQFVGRAPQTHYDCLLRLLGLLDVDRSIPERSSPQVEKTHTLETLIDILHRQSEQQPVFCMVEDAHWIDPTTDEFIGQLAQRVREWRVLLLVTCRPQYSPAWVSAAASLTRLSLNRLSQQQCTALVGAVSGKGMPPEVLAEIIRKTDGIPLFVEELTKTVLQSGLLEESAAGFHLRGPLPALAIPSTLQDSLMARLDRLASAKEVAQVGAVIGREFGQGLMAEVLGEMSSGELASALADLMHAELVFRRDAPPDTIYTFKHALVRDTAYNSMLKSQRALRHRQIAAALEKIDHEAVSTHPEMLAYHHQEAGNVQQALRYWNMAGDRAMGQSAMREAVTHYQGAVALLRGAAENEHDDEIELNLRIRLGNALFQAEGFTSNNAIENFTRARDLAASLDRPDEHLQACTGIAGSLAANGRIVEALDLLNRFEHADLARAKPMSRVTRLTRLGYIKMLHGQLVQAEKHLSDARHEYGQSSANDVLPQWGTDPLVMIQYFRSPNLVLLGRLASAEACAREAYDIGLQRPHLSQVIGLNAVCSVSALKGDWADVTRLATQMLEISERYGFRARTANANVFLARALLAGGRIDDGLRLAREGYAASATIGRFFTTATAANLALALFDVARRDEAIEFMLAGEKTQQETEEQFHAAQFLTLRGRIAELDGDAGGAQNAYCGALDTAEQQGATLLALRAATASARLWHSQGHADKADSVLRPVYDRFADGFDWPDLVRARAVLERRQ